MRNIRNFAKHTRDGHEIEPVHELILKKFFMKLRREKLYHLLLLNVKRSKIWSAIYASFSSKYLSSHWHDVNRFGWCTNKLDVMQQMISETEGRYNKPFSEMNDRKTEQMYICDCVNSLIHGFVEKYAACHEIDVMEIGRDVFNSVCEELYGEGFEDLTEQQEKPTPEEIMEVLSHIQLPDGINQKILERMLGFIDTTGQSASNSARQIIGYHDTPASTSSAFQTTFTNTGVISW